MLLEVALHLTDQYEKELEAFTVLSLHNRITFKYIIKISHYELVTNQNIIQCVPSIRQQFSNVLFGAGTIYNFTALNRHQFLANELDFVTLFIHPQAHAFDDHSILETTEAHRDVVKSAQDIHDAIPIHASPITLRK